MSKAYKIIADQMIRAVEECIETGETPPWNKPWNPLSGDYRTDHHSIHGRFYSGVNGMILRIIAHRREYKSRVWLTFKQIKARGGKLVEGKGKGVYVLGWFKPKNKDKDGNDEKEAGYLVPRAWLVWNGDHVEGMDFPEFGSRSKPLPEMNISTAEELLANMPEAPTLVHAEQRAYYNPRTDTVNMPIPETFKTADHYLSVLAHELGHSTGHATRLNRTSVSNAGVFGSYEYSREELCAEMTAAMVCGRLGIENGAMQNMSIAYIRGWLKSLKDDPKMLAIAGQQAEKAARWILNERKEEKSEKPDNVIELKMAA